MHAKSFAPLASLATCVFAQYRINLPVDNRTLDEIYAVAKQEYNFANPKGLLRVIWGGDAGVQGATVRAAWKQRFPDIPLNLTVDLSKYIDRRVDDGYFENTSVADVAVMQTLHDFPRWKAENKLLYYKPPTFDNLLQTEKDFDGAFLPVGINSFGTFIFDDSKLSSSDIPTSYSDLTNPTWKGKLILTYPNDDDAVAYLFSLIVSRYGTKWLYALAANDVQWVRGTGSPVLALTASQNTTSQRILTFTSSTAGSSIGSKLPRAPEQVIAWAQRGAILACTPRPAAAKLFMAWLSSVEHQASTVQGLNVSASQGTIGTTLESVNAQISANLYNSKISDITHFREFERDRAAVERWKNLFEDVLGTAQGLSPLLVYPNPPVSALST